MPKHLWSPIFKLSKAVNLQRIGKVSVPIKSSVTSVKPGELMLSEIDHTAMAVVPIQSLAQ
ncbi:MAG: hypothetical protein P8M30_19015 [Planctomycetaceae bacterium]|nr:hypothetical protein [Planctomycetaceae bacterium]MDB4786838.1 hypothetical protein [Planctomycetaceae bacterium]MDG2391404.1 hypothetical protein [Planctomycetaceae bacterium]